MQTEANLGLHNNNTHKVWVENGRPRLRLIFDNKTRAKLLYKNAIEHRQIDEQSEISNSLHYALCNKDSTTFWKMWKNKFGKKMYPRKL